MQQQIRRECYKVAAQLTDKKGQACSFAGVGLRPQRGTIFHTLQPGRACHAQLSYWDPGHIAVVEQIQTDYHTWKSNGGEAHRLAFINYLLKRSPWADLYMSTKASDVLKRGYVMVDMTGADRLHGAASLQVWRNMWEHSIVCKNFKPLVDLGVPPRLAHLLAHLVLTKGGYGGRGPSHCLLYPAQMDKVAVVNFVNGYVTKAGGTLFNQSTKYTGVSSQWGKLGSGYLTQPRIANAIQAEAVARTRNKKVKVNYNPFPVPGKVPDNAASLPATYAAVAHIYHTVIKQELGV